MGYSRWCGETRRCTQEDRGKEETDNYSSYDLWDENNNYELKEVKISTKYTLSTGDIIYINDLENINDIITDVTKQNKI